MASRRGDDNPDAGSCSIHSSSMEKESTQQIRVISDCSVFENGEESKFNDTFDAVKCFGVLDSVPEGFEIVLDIFRRSALLPGGALDEAVSNVFKAVNLSSSSSVLFTRYDFGMSLYLKYYVKKLLTPYSP